MNTKLNENIRNNLLNYQVNIANRESFDAQLVWHKRIRMSHTWFKKLLDMYNMSNIFSVNGDIYFANIESVKTFAIAKPSGDNHE